MGAHDHFARAAAGYLADDIGGLDNGVGGLMDNLHLPAAGDMIQQKL